MKKKYLKTVEDVLALKDTDTKIYREDSEGGYCQFIEGTLCGFHNDFWCIGATIDDASNCYILEEEPITTEDIHKLCWFWGSNAKDMELGILEDFVYERDKRKYLSNDDYWYYNCRRLTPSEVAEITGYGVTEDGSTFYGEPFKIVGKEK